MNSLNKLINNSKISQPIELFGIITPSDQARAEGISDAKSSSEAENGENISLIRIFLLIIVVVFLVKIIRDFNTDKEEDEDYEEYSSDYGSHS